MKRWLPKRYDRRHATVSPSRHASRARRLAFERCEDRRMLSGSSLTTEVANTSFAGEGGFLTVNTSSYLLNSVNNFLPDAYSFSQPTARLGLSAQWHLIGADQQIIASDFTSLFEYDISRPVFSADTTNDLGFDALFPASLGDEDTSSIASTIGSSISPSHPDLNLSDVQVLKPLLPTIEVNDPLVDENIIVDERQDTLANNRPGLPGNTAKLLVIEQPIQILTSPRYASEADQHEGGALEVAVAVHTTQRAYETQLSAVITSNLNRDGMLPTTVPMRVQPVIAELARAVAFETVALEETVQTSTAAKITEGPFIEAIQATPPALKPVAAQLRVRPVFRPTAVEATTVETTARVSISSRTGEDPSANLAERVENDQQTAWAMNFSQWPILATVIASYLLIERHSPQATQTVQTSPHCNRQTLAR